MGIVIKINTVDKSSEIDWKSVGLSRALTNQIDTLKFRIKRANSSGYKPELIDDIEVLEDGNPIFGGQIVEISEEVSGLVEYVEVTAKDYSFDMDKRLVVQVYEDMTVADIIDDIKASVLPAGYDTTNVVCDVVIKYIAFNYEFPSKCLQQLAQITNYDWYVNEEKEIFFFFKGSQTAPFNLTDTNGKYIYNSLKISKDISNIRNSIIVRGGTYEGNTDYEDQEADGDQTTFTYAYKYSNAVLTVAGSPKTIGIDFIDDPASFDALYNFQEKAIIFPTATRPTAGQIVRLTGNPHVPVITKLTNSASVALYGEFQYKIVDKSIGSKAAARDRARAEIAAWALEINEGSFVTHETTLDTGQRINISSVNRSIDQDYIISRISSKLDTYDRMIHTITLVTSQTYGMVEFLQKLLISKDKEIEIGQDEVLDSVLGLSDTIHVTDIVTPQPKTSGPYKWQPGTGDALWNFAVWG